MQGGVDLAVSEPMRVRGSQSESSGLHSVSLPWAPTASASSRAVSHWMLRGAALIRHRCTLIHPYTQTYRQLESFEALSQFPKGPSHCPGNMQTWLPH